MTIWLIIARSLHFGACLLFFGALFFDRFTVSVTAAPGLREHWKNRVHLISLVLLPLILISGVAWFAFAAMNMSDQPLDATILHVVWTQTQFGKVWKVRLLFFVVTVILSIFQKSAGPIRSFAVWVQTLAAGCLVASLAWAGHGQEVSVWHLFADVFHLLGAGIWPAGLLPMLLLLRWARRMAEPEDWLSVSAAVNRFSAISVATVLLLAVTGAVNAWYLVGSFSNFIKYPYGWWLLGKLALFCVALAIAAMNLLRLRPRMTAKRNYPEQAGATAARLKKNVEFELVLGSGIIAIVGVLGILPPAMH